MRPIKPITRSSIKRIQKLLDKYNTAIHPAPYTYFTPIPAKEGTKAMTRLRRDNARLKRLGQGNLNAFATVKSHIRHGMGMRQKYKPIRRVT